MKKLLVRLPIALAAVFILVAVCLLAVVATLDSIDLDQFRNQLAEQVHEATGRKLVWKIKSESELLAATLLAYAKQRYLRMPAWQGNEA